MKKLQDTFKFQTVNNKILKENFQKELSNPLFHNLVSQLDVDRKILEKNTSKLLDSVKELTNCNSCSNISCCKNQVPGFCYKPNIENESLVFEYQSCKFKNDLDKKNKFQQNIYLYEMPQDIKNARIKDIYTDDKNRLEIIKYLKKYSDHFFNQKEKGLYLYGNFGCGKTYLIAALFNELAKKDIKSAIIYFPEFLNSLKASFNNSSLFGEKLNYIKKVPLLLIDDIGAENVTLWSRDEILGPILQYRMQENLATFFTSNLSISELEESLSCTKSNIDLVKARRIIERIKYLTTEFKLISVNRRN